MATEAGGGSGTTAASVARPTGTPALEVHGLTAGYGGTEVVHEVDFTVGPGEMVALLGLNGAGKTTTVLATAGALPRAAAGEVRIAGTSVPRGRADLAARRGLACVPQERSLFTQLSVAENLRLAVAGGRQAVAAETARAVERFPALADLLGRRAGLLSGGEQRMVAVARALARHPRVLLVDEMSLGLGPQVVDDLGRALRAVVADEGTGVLLVEQHLDCGPRPRLPGLRDGPGPHRRRGPVGRHRRRPPAADPLTERR